MLFPCFHNEGLLRKIKHSRALIQVLTPEFYGERAEKDVPDQRSNSAIFSFSDANSSSL
jgi:hypothetical protein